MVKLLIKLTILIFLFGLTACSKVVNKIEYIEININDSIDQDEVQNDLDDKYNKGLNNLDIQIDGVTYNLADTQLYSELWELDDYTLFLLRNGIYAKYGYVFKNEELNDFFSKYSWYEADIEFSSSMFSIQEEAFIERIINVENSREKKIIYDSNIEFNEIDIRIVLSLQNEKNDDEIYNRIEIYSAHNNELLFDTNDLIVFQGAELEADNYFEIIESEHALKFISNAYASNPQESLLIMWIDEQFEVVLLDEITDLLWVDIDNDHINEIYGRVAYGGGTSFDFGFSMVYKLVDDLGYIASVDLTKEFEYKKLEISLQEFEKNKNMSTLDELLYRTAYVGNISECEKIIEENQLLYLNLIKEEKSSYFWHELSPILMAEYYKDKWELYTNYYFENN